MRYLLLGDEIMNLATGWRIQSEGNEVRSYPVKADYKGVGKGMIEQVGSLSEGLQWLGQDGVVLSDDERDMTSIRERGYKVYGGNAFTKRFESDRMFQLNLCKQAGLNIANYHQVKSLDEAIKFVRSNPDAWVLKQEGHLPKHFNYVSKEDDGSDMLDQLEWMKKQPAIQKQAGHFILQEKVEGMEFAVAAWWNGNRWATGEDGRPLIALNREHKKAGEQDTGSVCGESGTVIFFSQNARLFEETLLKLTPVFQKCCQGVAVSIDANCGIVEENGEIKPYLFEVTPRAGYPASCLEDFLLDMDAGEFYYRLACYQGDNIPVSPLKGVVVVLGSGRYPLEFPDGLTINSFREQPIYIPTMKGLQFDNHIAPFAIRYDAQKQFYRVATDYEWLLGVCYADEDILTANALCLSKLDEVTTRNPVHRFDIGHKFVHNELPILQAWGYA